MHQHGRTWKGNQSDGLFSRSEFESNNNSQYFERYYRPSDWRNGVQQQHMWQNDFYHDSKFSSKQRFYNQRPRNSSRSLQQAPYRDDKHRYKGHSRNFYSQTCKNEKRDAQNLSVIPKPYESYSNRSSNIKTASKKVHSSKIDSKAEKGSTVSITSNKREQKSSFVEPTSKSLLHKADLKNKCDSNLECTSGENQSYNNTYVEPVKQNRKNEVSAVVRNASHQNKILNLRESSKKKIFEKLPLRTLDTNSIRRLADGTCCPTDKAKLNLLIRKHINKITNRDLFLLKDFSEDRSKSSIVNMTKSSSSSESKTTNDNSVCASTVPALCSSSEGKTTNDNSVCTSTGSVSCSSGEDKTANDNSVYTSTGRASCSSGEDKTANDNSVYTSTGPASCSSDEDKTANDVNSAIASTGPASSQKKTSDKIINRNASCYLFDKKTSNNKKQRNTSHCSTEKGTSNKKIQKSSSGLIDQKTNNKKIHQNASCYLLDKKTSNNIKHQNTSHCSTDKRTSNKKIQKNSSCLIEKKTSNKKIQQKTRHCSIEKNKKTASIDIPENETCLTNVSTHCGTVTEMALVKLGTILRNTESALQDSSQMDVNKLQHHQTLASVESFIKVEPLPSDDAMNTSLSVPDATESSIDISMNTMLELLTNGEVICKKEIEPVEFANSLMTLSQITNKKRLSVGSFDVNEASSDASATHSSNSNSTSSEMVQLLNKERKLFCEEKNIQRNIVDLQSKINQYKNELKQIQFQQKKIQEEKVALSSKIEVETNIMSEKNTESMDVSHLSENSFHSIKNIETNNSSILCMQIYNDIVVIGCSDGCCKRFKIHDSNDVMQFTGHTQAITNLFLLDDILFTSSLDGYMLQFKVQNGVLSHSVYNDEPILCMCEGWKNLYLGLPSGDLAVYSMSKNMKIDTIKCAKASIRSVATTTQGVQHLFCILSSDLVITVWDAVSKLLLQCLEINDLSSASCQIKVLHDFICINSTVYNSYGIFLHELLSDAVKQKIEIPSRVTNFHVLDDCIVVATADGKISAYKENNGVWSLWTKMERTHNKVPVTCMTVSNSLILCANRIGIIEFYKLSSVKNI